MAKKIKKVIKKSFPKVKIEPVNLVKKRISDGVKRTKIRVIGIGGGGGSIVSELSLKVKKASFLVANTDQQALKTVSHNVLRFQFGQDLTHGLGTGMNWEIAKIAAQNEKEKIKKLLAGQDLCIFVACLGGGTGSGAVPIFAKISRNLGNLSYGIFTLPFRFEGEKKAQIAREALEKLKPSLNALSIIPNERIFQVVEKSTPLKTALSVINKNLAESLEDLIETIYEPGLINIDFADLKTVFEGRGRLTYLNSVEISSLGKNEEIIKKVLSSPLYPYTIRGAKGILFNIVGERNLELAEVSQISKAISDSASREAKIIFGVSQKQRPEFQKGRVKITLLATGCGQRVFPQKEKKFQRKTVQKKKKLEKERKKIKTPKIFKKPLLLKQKAKIKTKLKTQPRLAEPGGVQEKKRKKAKPKKARIKFPTPAPSPKKKIKEKTLPQPPAQNRIEVKIRRNALEIKKDVEEAEKEIIAEEKKWETPAFLRRKLTNKNNAEST